MANLVLMLLVAFVVGIVVAGVAHGVVRYSLRTLLVGMTLVAMALGLFGWMRADDGTLDEKQVLSIAKAAFAWNDKKWQGGTEFRTPVQHSDGTWGVIVWRLPKTPGSFVHITIDAKGRVTDYSGGL